jgi:pilus assembly protein CpaB
MILATLGAIVVFITVIGYVGSVRAEVGAKTEVLMLKRAIPAYSPVDPSMVERVQVPRRWSPQTMFTDAAELTGKVAASDLPQGSYLQRGMVIDAPALQPGQREIAILIDAETGVAGKVRAGMLVDIYASFQEQQPRSQRSCAVRVISQARVIQVGQTKTEQRSNSQTRDDVKQVVPITFALSTDDSLKLTYAESFATKVRLALIGVNTSGQPTKLAPVCTTPIAR